jgi:hypothetical protein
MNKIIPLQEMIEEIKKHYNLNDTLLALNLKVTPQTVKGWKNGNIPREKTYNKILEIYNNIINSEEQTKEVQEVTEVTKKKPYKIFYPKDGAEMYYIDDYTGEIEEKTFDICDDYDKRLYEIGLLFNTREEAEQFLKEQTLIKKIKCWAKEQQGDWEPDWSDESLKYDIYCHYGIDKELKISDVYYINDIKKLPYFKSKEIAQACIDEFGDEILEVFC